MNASRQLLVMGPIILIIPMLVAIVVCTVARREGTRLPVGALLRLVIATGGATGGALVASRFVAFPGFLLVTTAVLFFLFVLPVTQALERTVVQRIPEEPVRTAGLVARDIGSYIPLWSRSAVIVAGLILLWWVATRSIAAHPSILTITYTFAGMTFYGLYEAWIREEVFSVRAISGDDRRRRVRAIFGAQSTLMILFLLMAGLAADKWPRMILLAAIGVVAGSIGCAFALSTGIQERYLQAWSIDRHEVRNHDLQ